MPAEAAAELREDLIQYAVQSKDHSVSDEFILRFASRRSGAVSSGKDLTQIHPTP
jgi:hypothetical protein